MSGDFRAFVGDYMALRAEVEAHKREGAARKKRLADMERRIIRFMGDQAWRILILDGGDALEIKTDQPVRTKTDVEVAQGLMELTKGKRDQVERIMSIMTGKVPTDKPKTTLTYVPPQQTHAVMALANIT